MRHVGNVASALVDARDWVLDSAEECDEVQERLQLERARTAILWAARSIDSRLAILEGRRKQHEEAKTGQAYRAWIQVQGEGGNRQDRRPQRPA